MKSIYIEFSPVSTLLDIRRLSIKLICADVMIDRIALVACVKQTGNETNALNSVVA